MKLNSKEFEKYVINEVKNLCSENQWNEEMQQVLFEHTCVFLEKDEYELIEPNKLDNIKENKIDLTTINQLNEELKRMRELADFRNPFFLSDNN